MDFIEHLSTFEQVLWFIATPTTLIYLAMVVMTFVGMDGTDGIDADFDGDIEVEDGDGDGDGGTFQLFTFRNALAFMIGLGWGGLSLYDNDHSQTASIVWGCVIGFGFMVFQTSLFYFMYKLHAPNIPTNENAVGQKGTVYLTIPKNGNGHGKITVNVDGTSKTLNAITPSTSPLSTGQAVKVIAMEGDTAIVELSTHGSL